MQRAELTVFIVEDSPAVMERLVEAVGDVPNARVVGSAEAVAGALEGVRAQQPRVLILDVQLRDGSGFRLLKRMRAEGVCRPETIIIVTNYPNDDHRAAVACPITSARRAPRPADPANGRCAPAERTHVGRRPDGVATAAPHLVPAGVPAAAHPLLRSRHTPNAGGRP